MIYYLNHYLFMVINLLNKDNMNIVFIYGNILFIYIKIWILKQVFIVLFGYFVKCYQKIFLYLFFSFPNLAITRFLLTYCNRWIDIHAMELTYGNTALHISCQNDTDDSLAVVQLLINFGAHIDSLNMNKQTPFDLAQTN